MTRFATQMTPHMRLFELIRQETLAAERAGKPSASAAGDVFALLNRARLSLRR
ncbi:hypothetical protein [uncultured Tateyamaria sp.]|uniref:hypothetical protein n=1 Tax=uncultured Tateyamaria sp. TaxID=455651 RepID=UPI00261A504E|nr:hypothetical protein [uncultured Tateyamaria sp.]